MGIISPATQSPSLFLRQCGQKWLVIYYKIVLNFGYRSEEEAGPAGEQPASNKIDATCDKKRS